MRIISIIVLCVGFLGCAGPHIVTKEFGPERVLHIGRVGEIGDAQEVMNYTFYLDRGDIVPLKMQFRSSLFNSSSEQLEFVLKKKLFFRIEGIGEGVEKDIARLLELTPEEMTEMDPKELKRLYKKVKLYISNDGFRWSNIANKKGVKEVLGVEGGAFSFGMAVSEDEGMWFLASLTLHDKKNS